MSKTWTAVASATSLASEPAAAGAHVPDQRGLRRRNGCFASGAQPHCPAVQVFMPGHFLPQAPQLFLSLLVSMQAPVHCE